MQDVYIIWDDPFAKKVIKNLEGNPSKLEEIVGIYEVPSDLRVSSPSFVDEVEKYLPEDLPSCDIVLAIGVGSYLLSVPSIAEKAGAKGVVIPIEKSNWYQLGLLSQIKGELENMGVEYAFPRPFCSLEGRNRKSIEKFVEDFEMGRPSLKVDLEGGKITDVEVKVSAPCGNTYSVAEEIKGTPVSFEGSDIIELEDRVNRAWHSYPCTGDMEIDPILGETILHRSGYLVRNSVKEAVGVALKLEDKERETGEISEECSILCGECVESCDRSSTGILETGDERILIPNYERCNGCRHCVKVCPIDVAGKLVTKRDTLLIKEWENKELSN